MKFNIAKCFTMHMSHKNNTTRKQYKMGNNILQEVDHLHPYLGVELTHTMSWATHINQITTGANKILGLLRRNLRSCDPKTKDIAYKTLVRPKLDFCSSIWDPHINTHTELVTQSYQRETSVTKLMEDLKWDKLEIRRMKARLILLFKESTGIAPTNVDHLKQTSGGSLDGSTRNYHPNNYKRITVNKNCYKLSLYPFTIPEWNLLPADMKSTDDLTYFKTRLNDLDLEVLLAKAHYF